MKIKYAYIVFHLPFPFPRIEEPFHFDETTTIRTTTVTDEFQGEGSKHWSDWLGSLTWERLSTPQYLLSTWMEAKTPEVLDHENELLREKVSMIFRALPLVGPFRPPDDAYLFSGQGIIENGHPKATDIRSFTEIKIWTRAMFYSQWEEFTAWAETELYRPETLETWRNCSNHLVDLFRKASSYRQILEGHRSFEEALAGTQLEFKIPNLVRTLECVIDCWGQEQFAKRVLHLLGQPANSLPFSISSNAEELLKDLYQLRNDCSHGKIFAYSLEKKLGRAPDENLVAKYEFLAEWAARKALNDSFTNQSVLQHTSNRDVLIEAWKNGIIRP